MSEDFLKRLGWFALFFLIQILVLGRIHLFHYATPLLYVYFVAKFPRNHAKWAILAPVFVPMMMLMGYDPAITQVVYRIGDSITNPLSPLFTYMPVVLGFARKYDKNVGLGTIIANMLPFSVTFMILWIIQVILWVVFNIPLGPGGGIYL